MLFLLFQKTEGTSSQSCFNIYTLTYICIVNFSYGSSTANQLLILAENQKLLSLVVCVCMCFFACVCVVCVCMGFCACVWANKTEQSRERERERERERGGGGREERAREGKAFFAHIIFQGHGVTRLVVTIFKIAPVS